MLNIIKKPTQHFRKRGALYKPEIIVIHISTASIASCDSWFASPASQVSAHYIVGLKGEVHQYVDEKDCAYHAGRVLRPSFNLYKPGVNPNDYSIGIENEGQDLSKNSETQIITLAELVRDICKRWNIPCDREHIIGHYQVFADKPNCPATDKGVIDRIIARANNNGLKPEETVDIKVPKSKVDKVLSYLKTI